MTRFAQMVAATLVFGASPHGIVLANPDAPAEESEPAAMGPDEVILERGGFVRGTLVEVLPGSHVTIIVGGSHERRRIAFEEIERVERGKHADPEPPAREEAPAAESPREEVHERGKPRVHIETQNERSVTLFELRAEQQHGGPYGSSHGVSYAPVCASPCDRVVDGSSGGSFFVGQDIWTASPRFKLHEYTGDLTIRVRPGNKTLRILGAVLLGVGVGAAIGGGVFVFGERTRRTGVGLLAGGGAGIVIGTPMLVFGRTRYEMVRVQK